MTRAAAAPPPPPPWKDRIVGTGSEAPDQLLANPRNWRIHPKAQQDALGSVLDRVGWVSSVLVNRTTGRLVDGHLRVELALSRGEPTVPVSYVELSEEEEALVLASLDPLAAMAGTDTDKLRALLDEVTIDSAELEAMLRSLAPEPRIGLTDPDDVPEPSADPYVKPGELWLLGEHRLLVGDATKPEDVERLLGGATPRLLVTDPPYGVQLDPTWRDGIYNQLGPGAKPYMRIAGHHNTTLSGDTVVDWSPAFALVPSLEVAYVWHAGVHGAAVAEGLASLGFEIRSQIIWAKTQFAMSRGAYHWQHEPCWYAVRAGKTAEWLGDHTLSTLWELASPKMIMGGSDERKEDHPAQKPFEAMARPVRNHRGDVYEPFAGSGTTVIAAEQAGRRCYALEIEPRYAQVTIERWQAFRGRQAVRVDG